MRSLQGEAELKVAAGLEDGERPEGGSTRQGEWPGARMAVEGTGKGPLFWDSFRAQLGFPKLLPSLRTSVRTQVCI